MILQIGEVLKNSIEINELIPKKQLAKNSYVLLGVAQKNGERHIISSIVNSFTNEIEQVDVLYSINVKKNRLSRRPELQAMPYNLLPIPLSVYRICLKLSSQNLKR